jgi:hypothetical protein
VQALEAQDDVREGIPGALREESEEGDGSDEQEGDRADQGARDRDRVGAGVPNGCGASGRGGSAGESIG